MKAHIQATCLCIRAGEDFEKFGDPYDFACQAVVVGDTAFIFGAAGKYSRGTREAIRKELDAIGIANVEWSRLHGGEEKKVEREV